MKLKIVLFIGAITAAAQSFAENKCHDGDSENSKTHSKAMVVKK